MLNRRTAKAVGDHDPAAGPPRARRHGDRVTTRREFLITCGAGLCGLAASLTAFAQQPGKVRRIGFLGLGSASNMASRFDALRAGLRELGYVEGKNIAIEYRWAEGKYDRLPQLAAELVQLKVEVIVTHGTPGTRAAKQATSTIPIVTVASGDAVLAGLVTRFAHPGGNVTGSTFFRPEINAKRFELVKESLPGLSQVAVLVNPDNPFSAAYPKGITPVAKSLRVGMHPVEARSPAEFESAFAAMAAKRVDGVVVTEDPVLVTNAKALADMALKRRLPLIGGVEFAEAGGLIAFGANIPAMFSRAAIFVDRILKGARPADLPIEHATTFEFVVNLKTASALGLKIPQSILVRANRVIE